MSINTHTNRILAGIIAIVLGSCAAKHPLGFSQGNAWTIPLMGATGEGVPVTPVHINGKGPYLFFVSVDGETTIHPDLAVKLDLWRDTSRRTKLVNSKDDVSHEQIDFFSVPRLSVGDLTVSNRVVIGLKNNATYRGQPVLGTIGRDIVGQSSLIWSLDRDRQILRVATQGHFTPPADAQPVATTTRYGKTFVKARINDRITAELHVVIQGITTLWPALAAQAQLPVVSGKAWLAETIQLGAVRVNKQIVLPFADQRVADSDYDGTLGRDLWARHNVTMNRHENTMWLQPRAADPGEHIKERLQRWGERWAGCETAACVTIELKDEATASTAPERYLVITRAASQKDTSYDVLIEALDRNGQSMNIYPILVAMPPGFSSLSVPLSSLDSAYAAASLFMVTDATPYPPPCNSPQGCFWLSTQ